MQATDVSNDGEFQTVAPKSARRKEKLREHRVEHRERQRHHERQTSRTHSMDNKEKNERREHRAEKSVAPEPAKDKDEAMEVEGEAQPVKYVEAPLPVVNPWTRGKVGTTPAQAPTSSAPIAPIAPVAPVAPAAPVAIPVAAVEPAAPSAVPKVQEKPVEKEKKVLQPQVIQQAKRSETKTWAVDNKQGKKKLNYGNIEKH